MGGRGAGVEANAEVHSFTKPSRQLECVLVQKLRDNSADLDPPLNYCTLGKFIERVFLRIHFYSIANNLFSNKLKRVYSTAYLCAQGWSSPLPLSSNWLRKIDAQMNDFLWFLPYRLFLYYSYFFTKLLYHKHLFITMIWKEEEKNRRWNIKPVAVKVTAGTTGSNFFKRTSVKLISLQKRRMLPFGGNHSDFADL